MIYIQEHDGQRRTAALALGEPALKFLVERAAIRQTRQRVGPRLGDLHFQLPGLTLQLLGVMFQVIVIDLDQQCVAHPGNQIGAVHRLA